ncbi:MAG: DUF1178 family protein [Pseudomonadota bacterium]
MIAFDMECSNGHIFEGWFNNAQSFEEQNSKKLISCPLCNDTNVRKMISPVTMKIASQDNREKIPNPIDYRRLAKEVVEYINNHFEDVGTGFTKEALKMHYGVAEKKNIKGSATLEEEKLLKDEGVDFFKVPLPKVDKGKKN